MLSFFLRNYWLLEKPHSSKAIGRLTTAQQEGDGSVFYFVKMFGISLGLTILIELAVAAPFGMRTRKKILLVLLVNVLTNPPAVLAYWLLGRFLPEVTGILLQLPIEAVAVAAAAFVYCSFAKEPQWEINHPIALTVTANLCSWLCGVMLSGW